VASCCECGVKPRDSIKCGEFCETLRNCQLFKNESVLWSLFGPMNMLTAGNKYVCHVVFHIGVSGVFELN
jgi:hypothetical protein